MKLAELPQVLALSTAEKLELVEELWDSLIPEIAKENEISEEEKNLLDERWKNYLAHPESALTLDQTKALMAARREK
jgi:putative addiction module component (TIGR02574 family)